MPTAVPICLVDRYDGVRVALAEALAARGAAVVVAEGRDAGAVRGASAALVVAGLDAGDLPALLAGRVPVVVYTWLPADERPVDLAGAAAVVHLDLVDGLVAAIRRAAAR
jgi:NAD(P)-dependent dehydrogenase (short-subunit alcohol dehydrogenase family)